jgi:hypothetical protein
MKKYRWIESEDHSTWAVGVDCAIEETGTGICDGNYKVWRGTDSRPGTYSSILLFGWDGIGKVYLRSMRREKRMRIQRQSVSISY